MPCELEKCNLDRQMVEFWLQLCAHKRAVSECIIIKKKQKKCELFLILQIYFEIAFKFCPQHTCSFCFFFLNLIFCIWAAERCDYDDADDIHRKYTKKSYQPRPWQWECVFFILYSSSHFIVHKVTSTYVKMKCWCIQMQIINFIAKNTNFCN